MGSLGVKLRRLGIYMAITLMAAGSLMPADVGAQYYGGLSANRGYFSSSNRISTTENDSVLPAYSNSGGNECYYTYEGGRGKYAIPTSPTSRNHAMPRDLAGGPSGNSKQTYRNFLYAQYHSNRCDNKTTFGHPSARTHRNWTRDGVTFIVRTMLGHPPGSSRTLSSADWREFDEKIVDNPNIVMRYHSSSSPSINSRSFGYGRFPHPKTSVRDIGFYTSSSPPTDEVFRFTSTSGYRYEIKLRCANPAGNINTNIPPVEQNWSISGRTTANRTTARPGDTVTWTHTIRNDGPDATTESIVSNARRTPGGNTYNRGVTSSGQSRGQMRQFSNNLRITDSHLGGQVCERAQWDPVNSDGSRDGRVSYVCVNVPYSYGLTPNVRDLGVVGAVEPGTRVTVRPYVNNSGPTRSDDARWEFTRFTLPPTRTTTPSGGTSSSSPCVHFSSIDCSRVTGGTREFSVGNTNTPSSGRAITIEDLEAGSRVCFALSVQPYSHNSSRWRHSTPRCVTVGKKPKLQVWGGDVMVGGENVANSGNVNTSTSTKGSRIYGSWGEYATLARGTVSGFASAAALAQPAPPSENLHSLTFANVGTPGRYNPGGGYWPRPLAMMSDRVRAMDGPQVVSVGSVSLPSSGHVPTTVPRGQSIIVVSSGTVTIDGSIRYDSTPISNISDIPQVVIIANNINIESSVDRIDAWLLARGSINTCSDGPSELRVSDCDKLLEINGPVAANKLHLRRTAGSGTGNNSGDPAEIINLRADAYLWAYAHAGSANSAQTVLTTEMPPRF